MTENPNLSPLEKGVPSPTAQWVATLRAVHNLLDDPPVLCDPLCSRLLNAEEELALNRDPFKYNDPFTRFLRAKIVVRTRLAFDEHMRAVASGVEQHVLLGAGLDTFAYAQAFCEETVRIFEVDHPSTQNWKRQRLSEAGIIVPNGLTFVPVDFELDELDVSLPHSGFDPGKKTCLSWLGVTPYLSSEAISSVLKFVARLPRGSSITFDYHSPPTSPLERALAETGAERVRAKGEHFLSSFEPETMSALLHSNGFDRVENWDSAKLNAMYLANRKDGLQAWASMARATV